MCYNIIGHLASGRKLMKMKDFIKAAELNEYIHHHVKRSLAIGSKTLKHVSEQNIRDILVCFDQAYANLINEKQEPGRQEFCLKTNTPIGTNAVVSINDIKDGAAFEIVCRLGTPRAGKVKVALINKKDMPTTNLVHGFYGPYGKSGKAGIYKMTFGQPDMDLPKQLGDSEPDVIKAYNQECCKFWNGDDKGNAGHVFLATPDELKAVIKQMNNYGMQTKSLELRLEAFFRGGEKSPLKKGYQPPQKSINAVDLGNISLSTYHHKINKSPNY